MESLRQERREALKARDAEKGGTEWYKAQEMLGMMLYIDNFAGDLTGVKESFPTWKRPM